MSVASAPTIDELVERAKRAFALKKYEEAVDHYATALEEATSKYESEDAPELADLYLEYGKALLENAISQASVLGKEGADEAAEQEEDAETAKAGKILSFSGDAEDDPAVDLFAQAEHDAAEEEGEEGKEDGEPEDDFNAAWEVLDLARAIYEKQKDGDDEIRLKLADTFIALGDVSLETEKFDQAITDYSAGLELKTDLLPLSSRQIAEAHYKLSMVLDLTSGRLADAIMHAQTALESVEARLAALNAGLASAPATVPEQMNDAKGKGKAKGTLVRDEDVANMSKSQIEAELKELSGLKEDLALKVEELKTSPNEDRTLSAPELAARALDRELNGGAGASSAPLPVNDLTSMVVKKKKKPPVDSTEVAAPSEKRKADDEMASTPPEKKARLDEQPHS